MVLTAEGPTVLLACCTADGGDGDAPGRVLQPRATEVPPTDGKPLCGWCRSWICRRGAFDGADVCLRCSYALKMVVVITTGDLAVVVYGAGVDGLLSSL